MLASLLAHAALIFWSTPRPSLRLAIGGQSQALRVSLLLPRVMTARAVPPHETTVTPPRTPPAHVTDHEPDPALPRKPQRAAHKRLTVTEPARPPHPHQQTRVATARPPQQVSTLSVSKRISAALKNRLSERFEYPWLARKRGWQGMVTLSLQVEDNGNLTHWRISKTSGHLLLDRSALKAARAIGHLPEAVELLNGQSLNLSIPVRYRLL